MFKQKCLIAVLLTIFCMQSYAELRDPTRPTALHPEMMGTDDVNVNQEGALNLQAIFYSPTQSSALINGQRFIVGDHVADAEIKEIFSDRVVLFSTEGVKELQLLIPSVKSRVKPAIGMK